MEQCLSCKFNLIFGQLLSVQTKTYMVETVHYICYFCFTDLFKSFELIDPAVSSIVNIVTLFFHGKTQHICDLGRLA